MIAAADTGDQHRAVISHVLLDRDGVLNREGDRPIRDVEDWRWERGALRGIAGLARTNVAVSIVTNQACIGRGEVRVEDVDRLHRWLTDQLLSAGVNFIDVFMCPHSPDVGCECRKPLPGLILQAMRRSGVLPRHTLLVGDDLRDLDAGAAAGTRLALLRTGKGSAVESDLIADGLHTGLTIDHDLGSLVDSLESSGKFGVSPSRFRD